MTRSAAETFNLTHAKYLAAKVTSDMRRCQQLYGSPGDPNINDYGTELAFMLRDKYVADYEFGWIRKADDERVLTWRYTVDVTGDLTGDNRPGKLVAGYDVTRCSFRTYMNYTSKWWQLSDAQRVAYKASMPVKRQAAQAYGSSLGGWHSDLTYSSTGVAMVRQTFKKYGT